MKEWSLVTHHLSKSAFIDDGKPFCAMHLFICFFVTNFVCKMGARPPKANTITTELLRIRSDIVDRYCI